jgi:geranylgeranyl diphosphate synthase type I
LSENRIRRILLRYRTPIERTLKTYLDQKKLQLGEVNRWGPDLTDRLYQFSTGGKLIRGSLILFSFDMVSHDDMSSAGTSASSAAASAAAAYELIHSFLLIHDDIMDRDSMRRGMRSIFSQYKALLENESGSQSLHEGEGLGICAGDVALLFAVELLARSLSDHPERTLAVLLLWSGELQHVGIAQMQDVYFSTLEREVKEEDILALYRYKTARYTFSVPLATGAILAGQTEETVRNLMELGEYFGLIYQIVDDRIGLFGDAGKTGKPVGGDLSEKKKTLYYHYLFRLASQAQKRRLSSILKGDSVNAPDLEYVREVLKVSGAFQRVEEKIEELRAAAEHKLECLPVGEENRAVLVWLLEHGIIREG